MKKLRYLGEYLGDNVGDLLRDDCQESFFFFKSNTGFPPREIGFGLPALIAIKCKKNTLI